LEITAEAVRILVWLLQ